MRKYAPFVLAVAACNQTPSQQPVSNALLLSSTGHSEYLRDGTTSAWNIAVVVADRPDLRIVERVAP